MTSSSFLPQSPMERGKVKRKRKRISKSDLAWKRNSPPPVRQRPATGRTALYSRVRQTEIPLAQSVFDPELMVLAKQEGPVLGLESTSTLTAALRGLLLQGAEGKPEWFTGHSTEGNPATGGHLAVLPLPFVSAEHADGHIMGLALAFPRAVSMADRAACLRGRIFGPSGEDLDLELKMGSLGTWTVRREERSSPPRALLAQTWCECSRVWASVTPVVLDRHPKHDRRTERENWRDEVAASIVQSCERQGLPRPELVDVDKTSWHRGAPRSQPGPDGMPWLREREIVLPGSRSMS